MKVGVLEQKAQEGIPPLVLCASTGPSRDSGPTNSSRVKRHKNELRWAWKKEPHQTCNVVPRRK